MNALDTAIESLGGVTKLADALGLRQSAVSNWRARGKVPEEQCPAIERATNGAVLCDELRPDVAWKRDHTGKVVGYQVDLDRAEPTEQAA